ncbi:MAG: prolyl oligopeptidase family serine peptidase [Candidatus Baltobacteraceae bacterium]
MKRLLLTLALVGAVQAGASARPIVLNDLKSLTGVSDAVISPDGVQIAYIVSTPDFKADRTVRRMHLYDLHAGADRIITFDRNDVSSPAWSPDGSRLAFIAHDNVFVMDMRGGEAMPITRAARGVQQFAWRPDGNAIAFVTRDEPKNKRELARHVKAFVVGDQSYVEEEAPTPSHIWLATPGAPGQLWDAKRLTHGAWSLPPSAPPGSPSSPLSWSPDGRFIAFSKMSSVYFADGHRSVVCVLDTRDGSIRTLTSHGKLEGYGTFAPDGTKIAYWYPYQGNPAAENDVYVTAAGGGNGSDVTAEDIDTNVQRAIWMPDSQSLLVSGHNGTDAALWIKPLQGKARRLDLHGVQPVQAFWLDASVAKTGALAFVGSQAHHPNELYYMSSPSAAPKALTSYNDTVAALDLGDVRSVTWTSEGYDEDGVVTYPPGYDARKNYPLALIIHGGPNSASIASFNAMNQLLAARGIVVFNPNYRGSDNLGERYWYGIFNDAGAGPGRDVIAGIAAVQTRAHIDKARIGVSGWSYGGYMTSWMEGHYHFWRAAVAGAAVNNWIDEYALSDNNVSVRFAFGGSPWTGSNLQQYLAQSPITYAWDITTPTLILSDTKDARVPITQSYEMFRTLRDRGTPVKFYAYPVAGDFPSDPVRAMDVDRRWIDWLVRYLK